MEPKRKIKAKEFLIDVKAGLTDAELIEKYRISSQGLQSIFSKLIDGGLTTREELFDRMPSYEDTINVDIENLRFTPDDSLSCLIPMFEHEAPDNQGRICDVSERSVEVTGLSASVNSVKRFIITPQDFFPVDTIVFDAKCRWTKTDGGNGEPYAAFDIVAISDRSREQLRELVRLTRLDRM
jgi:hypothetical protein